MSKGNKQGLKNLFWYFTLFKIEGHETWRAHLGSDAESLDRTAKVDHFPKITERKILKVDKVTGEITMKTINV